MSSSRSSSPPPPKRESKESPTKDLNLVLEYLKTSPVLSLSPALTASIAQLLDKKDISQSERTNAIKELISFYFAKKQNKTPEQAYAYILADARRTYNLIIPSVASSTTSATTASSTPPTITPPPSGPRRHAIFPSLSNEDKATLLLEKFKTTAKTDPSNAFEQLASDVKESGESKRNLEIFL